MNLRQLKHLANMVRAKHITINSINKIGVNYGVIVSDYNKQQNILWTLYQDGSRKERVMHQFARKQVEFQE